MTIVIGIAAVLVVGFALSLAYSWAVAWTREAGKTRFVFEDRDTYLYLKLDHPLGSDERAMLTMHALREALRLKLSGVGYERLLVETSALRFANARAFGLLIEALAATLRNDEIKLAVVCRRRTQAAKLFHESGILNPFPSVRDGERYLQSGEARHDMHIDTGRLEALLTPGGRRKAA